MSILTFLRKKRTVTTIKQEWLDIDQIGKISIVYKRNKSGISAYFQRTKQVIVVSVPEQCSQKRIMQFIEQHSVWFQKTKKFAHKAEKLSPEKLEYLSTEGKKYLPERIKYLSQKHNIQYRNLTLKFLRSKWGSCSTHNDIVLNLLLMQLPPKLIDYVILHEINHIQHKNHGPAFWSALEELCGEDPRQLRKAIKNYANVTF